MVESVHTRNARYVYTANDTTKSTRSVHFKYTEGPGFNPQLGPDFSGFLYSLRKLPSLEEFTM